MNDFFELENNKTNVRTEIIAGLTTFFAMSYIIFVNPQVLSQSGMPYHGVFIATCLASAIATFAIALIANVPYALGPGLGLSAFFTYTVVLSMGFTWQEALAMVFICGIFNVLITITRLRQIIIRAIPESLQNAISGGIGIFVAYIGLKNANLITFSLDSSNIATINGEAFNPSQQVYESGINSIGGTGGVLPALTDFTDPMALVAIIGIIITVVLLVRGSNLAVIIGIFATSIIAWIVDPTSLFNFSWESVSFSASFGEFEQVLGAALGSEGLGSLLSDPSRFPIILVTIFAFGLSDVFDTIGTFIGTGRKAGIFTENETTNIEVGSGFQTKMDKALFGDSIGTSIGAVLGTSNITTFVESAAGIGAGGRTGLASIVTGICFILAIFLSPIISLVPSVATAPALVAVGIMMVSSFSEIDWESFEEAVPAFFASVFMGLAYSISYGIAAGFLAYIVVKLAKGKIREIHPVIWGTVILFVINFIIMAML